MKRFKLLTQFKIYQSLIKLPQMHGFKVSESLLLTEPTTHSVSKILWQVHKVSALMKWLPSNLLDQYWPKKKEVQNLKLKQRICTSNVQLVYQANAAT